MVYCSNRIAKFQKGKGDNRLSVGEIHNLRRFHLCSVNRKCKLRLQVCLDLQGLDQQDGIESRHVDDCTCHRSILCHKMVIFQVDSVRCLKWILYVSMKCLL